MPPWRNCQIEPLRYGWNRSAAKTPACAVNDDSTRIAVLTAAKVTFRVGVDSAHSSGEALRSVK